MIELLNDSEHSIRDYVFAELNFHTSYEPARCVRNERFKYVKYYDNDWSLLNLSNIDNSRPKDFLLEHDLRKIIKPKEALYDMLYDPLENNNIIDQDQYHAELVKLKKYMNDVQLKTNDPLQTHHIEIMPEYKVNKSECVNPSSKDPEDYI